MQFKNTKYIQQLLLSESTKASPKYIYTYKREIPLTDWSLYLTKDKSSQSGVVAT